MSVFLVKILKCRGGWGLCPQTPIASDGWGLPPRPPVVAPFCRIVGAPLEKPMNFCPPEILGWLRHCSRYDAEVCNEWRGPSPGHSASVTQKRRNGGNPLATVVRFD